MKVGESTPQMPQVIAPPDAIDVGAFHFFFLKILDSVPPIP